MKYSISYFCVAGLLTSCTNTLFVGHDHAYDANVSLSADVTKVVSINAGFEGRSFAAVPPADPLHPKDLANPNRVPKGEVLSTLSAMKVQKVIVPNGGIGNSAAALDFVASTATGDAADAVAKSVRTNPTAAKDAPSDTPAGEAENITNSTSSIQTNQVVETQ